MRELVGLQVWSVALCWQRTLNRELKQHGLTHRQFVVLDGIGRLSPDCECVTQAALAEITHGDPMTTSTVVRTLEQRGLVARSPHPSDARAHSLELTTEGIALLQGTRVVVERLDCEMFGEEINAELRALLSRCLDDAKPH